MRLQNDVNVIGHYYPGEKIVTLPNRFAVKQRFNNRRGNYRVRQPLWAVARAIQLPIVQEESFFPTSESATQNCRPGLRKRAEQTPC